MELQTLSVVAKLKKDQVEKVNDLVGKFISQNIVDDKIEGKDLRKNLEYNVFKSGEWHIWFNHCELDDIWKIIEAFPVTEEHFPWSESDVKLAYAFRTHSPAKHDSPSLSITWISGEYQIRIRIAISKLPEIVRNTMLNFTYRKPTDSECHYFTGTSMAQIRRINIIRYVFMGRSQGFYGGDDYLLDPEETDKLMKNLLP